MHLASRCELAEGDQSSCFHEKGRFNIHYIIQFTLLFTLLYFTPRQDFIRHFYCELFLSRFDFMILKTFTACVTPSTFVTCKHFCLEILILMWALRVNLHLKHWSHVNSQVGFKASFFSETSSTRLAGETTTSFYLHNSLLWGKLFCHWATTRFLLSFKTMIFLFQFLQFLTLLFQLHQIWSKTKTNIS